MYRTAEPEYSIVVMVYMTRSRIVGQNPEKSLKRFYPCYSQSPLQLCIEISISSNSRNLLQFLEFSYCTLYSNEERRKT
jgi:hypothetical protein